MAIPRVTKLPIWSDFRSYSRTDLVHDLQAGLTVGVMLIPQGMAYAMLAGFPAIYGLYAGLVPMVVYAMLGSSRQLSVGPTAIASLLVLSGLAPFAEVGSAPFLALAITVAFLSGLFQVVLGVARLGFLVNFLSHPVLTGFTSAAAIIIGLSQMKPLLKLDVSLRGTVWDQLPLLAAHLANTHWPSLAVGLGGLTVLWLLKKFLPKVPGALVVVALATLATWWFDWHAHGLAIVGEVPGGLPPLSMPSWDLGEWQDLLPLGLTITLISFIESLAIAKMIEGRHPRQKVKANQELIALGMSKVAGSFFSAFPTTGSFTRSAVNDLSGARTAAASLISALMLVLTLLFFTPLFYYLPTTILAAIILRAVIGLVDVGEMKRLWRSDRRDLATLGVTLLATLVLGIQGGVLVGVILSLSMIIYRQSRPNVAVLGRLPGTNYYRSIERFKEANQQSDVLIMRYDAPLYFGNSAHFRRSLERLLKREERQVGKLVLDASAISDIDSTGTKVLGETIDMLERRDIRFALSGATGPVRDRLKRCGLMDRIGRSNQFMYLQVAVDALAKGEDNGGDEGALQTNV